MKKFIFIYFTIFTLVFGQVIDNAKLFQEKDKNILTNRTKQLQEMHKIDFIIVTNTEKDYTIQNMLKNKERKIIVSIVKEREEIASVTIMLSNDLDLSSYSNEIEKILDSLEVLILNGEYGNYTFELLANIGDILNIIKLDTEDITEKPSFNYSKIFIVIFKILIILFLLALAYYFYMFFMKKKNLTKCSACGRNMLIDQELEKEDSIMKIYKCSACGKIKRINKKRY